MQGLLGNKRQDLTLGDTVSFTYNDKLRLGLVEKLADEYLTLELRPEGTGFKSFRFDRMQSDLTIVHTKDGQSGFVAGLKALQK